jgi:hypothetical protein
VSVAKSSLLDKLTEFAETSTRGEVSPAEARAMMESLQRDFPETDKFIWRKFHRLPEALQRTILELMQRAEARSYASFLQECSSNSALSLSLRTHALRVLKHLGEPIDAPYHEALLQATQLLSQLQTTTTPPLTETGELQPGWRDAVLNLPLTLALDVGHALIADHPTVALAVMRALLPIVDAKDCRALVEKLASIPLIDSVTTLQALLVDTTDKSLQKTIKKALHRLRAQGLAVEDTHKRPHSVVVGSVAHRLEKCLASFIDGAGDRVIWMIRTKPFGGYNIAYLVINYGTGIQMAMGLQVSKRELPELLAKAQERTRLVELDPVYCQYQVTLAHQMNLETRTPVPEEFFALRDIIGESDTTFDRALIYSVLADADLQEAAAYRDHAEDLLQVAEFAGWTLPAPIIQKYGDMLRDVEESQIVVSSALQQERINEIRARASEEVLGQASRHLMRMRLEEMAYYLLCTERRREALWAVAAAQSMQEEEPMRQRHNRFIEALLERSLESAKERPGSRIIQPFSHLTDRGESSLIV